MERSIGSENAYSDMKQRSQGSGAKPIHRREVFNGTDTDTKAKSEPEKSALYLLERQTGQIWGQRKPSQHRL